MPKTDTDHLQHFVSGRSLTSPWPPGSERAIFGMGCFWGAERYFWQLDGVHVTAVGYAGGELSEPDYEQVCSGTTGHTEVILVVFNPAVISYRQLLCHFWEMHDPTQGMRQGNDVGSQYRSAIYCTSPEQLQQAVASRDSYQELLAVRGYGPITTEITEAGGFHYAEEYHQQYLAKNPLGYCNLGGTGVEFQVADRSVA